LRSYLFVFNGDQVSRKSVISKLDSLPEVVNWMAFFDNAICIVSEIDAIQLSEVLRASLPGIQFIVTELEPGKKKGWLPKAVWNFMNDPAGARTEAAE